MTGFFLMATHKIFQVILKIWPKIFLFFFQPQIEFRTQTNIFRKIFFFLDTIKLVFIFFSLECFFKNVKIPISSVWSVNVCLDQCLIN